jgi:tetratricopeptide (TPR) repeat protein
MRRGQIGRAIEKFASAHKKSPNFADPLLLWGEALMFKNLSHLALEKFTEAARTAPNWGRLHLKWGEALWYTGDRDGAAKHFAKAETLWLFPDERDELARMKAKHV